MKKKGKERKKFRRNYFDQQLVIWPKLLPRNPVILVQQEMYLDLLSKLQEVYTILSGKWRSPTREMTLIYKHIFVRSAYNEHKSVLLTVKFCQSLH